jgi:hypothetical protein
MDNTTPGINPQSGHRTSFWVIGFILLGVIVVVLATAFLLNQHFRSHVGIEPAVHRPTRSALTPTPHTGGVGPATAQATSSVAPTPIPAATPTVAPTPRTAVMEAYDRYWKTYSQALYTLNTSAISQVAGGNELRRVKVEVASFRQKNDAVHVRVSHHALIIAIKGNSATIYDEQHDGSWAIDPVTKEPHQGPNWRHLEKDFYYLKNTGGVWKVVKSVRQEG